ncbi:zinc finger protein 831 [Carlito syrichta]|uniref:Zinc finger protein 831 n=1 Tax=Carlito syrichta TaxID=1868482 RepID=A0A1U7U0G0_CARSF|nr:zinc finger protein 831 [Carlito syrichta]
MEVPEPTCPAPPARDQPAPAPGPPGVSGGQASSHLALGPIILPPEQGLAPTMFLKALPISVYHTVPPGSLQPRAPLVTGSLEGGSMPFILSPLLQPEGPSPTQVGKPVAPMLTVNIVGTLPVLSPGLGPTLGGPGKVRNAGKYLCPHCGRDCLKPSVLEKHIRSHTGERPFPCATCGIAFKTQSNLYKHRRTQTHLNNSRLSSESDGTGSSLLEEGDKAGEASRSDSWGENHSQRMGEGASERPPSPGVLVSLAAKKPEAIPCPGATSADREVPLDSVLMVSPGLPPAGTQPWRKLQEQKSSTASKPGALQRQQATSAEKPWDTKVSEGQLRKCESTDSGYLSRSDSVEQPPAPCSPLHSVSEHSAESEGESGPGHGVLGLGSVEQGTRGTSLELEKRRLEERIARLISHNQAVVDDAQLDTVRPRKTGLSKQGSIDLPMPYTYKDSFHFDIRALEPSRRRALGPARSTWTPPDKSRPLFFHSVPTQLSTTMECVPVTRSNSLPFVEGSRTWPEPRDPQDTGPRTQKFLSPKSTPAHLGCHMGLTSADTPGGHPRALVRQAAVEDLPGTTTGDASTTAVDLDAKRTTAREAVTGKGRVANRRSGQKRLKMFSQEKWQVYGDETFKRIYQKMKARHGGKKAREVQADSRTELDLLPHEDDPTRPQDTRTSVCGDISAGAKPQPWGNPPALEASLVTELPKQGEMVARVGDSDQPSMEGAKPSPTLDGTGPSCSGSKSPLLPPSGRLELGCQLPPVPTPLKGRDLETPRLVLPDPRLEGGAHSSEDVKKTCLWAQTVLSRPSGSSGEDKLPSERKKLKMLSQGPLEPVEAELMQAASLLSQKQDSEPGTMPGGSCETVGEPLKFPGASLATASIALKQVGLRDKAPSLHPPALVPRHCSLLATQPRAPGVLSALADNAFPPKYLLRLPQAETLSLQPVPRGPRQSQNSVYRSGQPGEQVSSVGLGLGTPLSSGPVSGPFPDEADSWSRQWDERKGTQSGEKGDRIVMSISAVWESLSPGVPRETTSSPPAPTCDAYVAQDIEGETHATHHLCMGSILARARPSRDVSNPWAPNLELGGAPENAPEDPPSGSPAGLNACCPLQPSSFLTQPQGVPLDWPKLALSFHSGTPRGLGAQSPFPSLKAEPRLTWCCLSRSLPLPEEQKAKAASVYAALHIPGSSLQGESPMSHEGWTLTSTREGEPMQMAKLSYPRVPGMMSQDHVSAPERKKGLLHWRARTFRGNSKEKKLRTNPKRYKGSFLQSRIQLRASRLRKPTWVPRRRYPPPQPKGLDPGRTCGQASSETAGLSLQEELSCATSESSVCCGNQEKKKDDYRQTSGLFSPSTRSMTVREINKLTVKDISPSAGECGDCSHNTAARVSGLSLQSDTCRAVVKDSPLPHDKGLDLGMLETQLLPSQDQILTDPKPCIFSDAHEPSTFGPKGTFLRHDIATSVAVCLSLGVTAGDIALGTHSKEPQDYSWAAVDALAPSSPDSKATAENSTQILLPGRPSSGQRISGLVPLGATGKAHLEIPDSGPSSTSSHQKEGRPKTFFPSKGQYVYEEVAISFPSLGSDSEKCQVSELIPLKGSMVSPNPGQPTEIPEAPSKSVKKRSLEGMRKQTRVEFSDTSSDDEDRLVIEI